MLTFFYTYANWHYTLGFLALLSHGRNFLSFLWNFFSIPDLLRTLFSPWRRLRETYDDGYDIQDKLATLLVNTIMRIVGAIVRLAVIAFGILAQVLATAFFIMASFIWLLLPAVVGVILVVIIDILL